MLTKELSDRTLATEQEEDFSILMNNVWVDRDNQPHREDGPASMAGGMSAWWKHGKIHRDNGPALTWENGGEGWLIDGIYHREDGPAYIDGAEKIQYWYINGKLVDESFVRTFGKMRGK